MDSSSLLASQHSVGSVFASTERFGAAGTLARAWTRPRTTATRRDRTPPDLGASAWSTDSGGTLPERGLTYEELVHLIYPTLPEEFRDTIDAAGSGDLTEISTVRRMLGTIEHQVAPTAFSVQLTEVDAEQCTVGGVELFCDAADAAVTPGLRSGSLRAASHEGVRAVLRPGMTVVDVGANLGYYSLLASRLVGTSGRVIALEPNSENCRLLLSSLRLNGSTNVELLPVAADVATGWAYYSTHVGSNGGLIDGGDLLAHPGVVVPTFRLDELVSGRVDFLKMDVEGAEGRVVRGATGIIERDRPDRHHRAEGRDADPGLRYVGPRLLGLLREPRLSTDPVGQGGRRREVLPLG